MILSKISFKTGEVGLLLFAKPLDSRGFPLERDFFERWCDLERDFEASGLRDLDLLDELMANLVK